MTDTMTAWPAIGGRTLDDQDAFRAEQRPVPELRPRDILVRVRAVSINPADTKSRSALQAGNDRILGWDAAGVVEQVGPGVTLFSPGDEVWYAGDVTRDGTNAELHAVDERIVARKPASLDWAEAAAMPLTSLTAWECLFDRLRLDTRSTGELLVVGGAGGVGSILIQLARQLTGVRVLATASRAESAAWATELGAHTIIDPHALLDAVPAVSPDGVDYVFSSHTAGNVEAFAQLIKPFGHLVAIDDPESFDVVPLKDRSITVSWELMFTRSLFTTPDLGEQGQILRRIADLVDSGSLRSTLRTQIDDFSENGLREAHQLVSSGGAVGKVVVAGE